MSNYRVLKDTSNSAKNNMRKHSTNYQYFLMERQNVDLTNFRRKPYSTGGANIKS